MALVARTATLVATALLALVTAVSVAVGPGRGARGEGAPVILPGREREVMALLAPVVARGFRGLSVASVPIARGEVRVQLAPRGGDASSGCALPPWASSPGALVLAPPEVLAAAGGSRVTDGGLALAWHLCAPHVGDAAATAAEARSLLAAVRARDRGDVWSAPAGADGAGLLTPAASALGVRAVGRVFVPLALALAFAATLAAAWTLRGRASTAPPAPPPDARRARAAWALALALLVAGAGLRVRFAATLPLECDEPWAKPSPHAVLGGDHDARVHPPAFRAVQQCWARAIGWREGDGLLALRGLSLAASLAALALLAKAAARARHPLAALPLAVPALAPELARADVIARPYGLAAALLVAGAASLWEDAPDAPALRWSAALAAMGLCAWTDLLAGAAAALLVAASIVTSRLPARARAALALAALLWLAPLCPGAVAAARGEVRPAPAAHAVADPRGPDLRPETGMGRGSPVAFAATVMQLGAFGRESSGAPLALAGGAWVCLVAAMNWRRRRVAVALGVALALAAVLAAGLRVGMRPRNVLFLPYLVALAALGAWGPGRPTGPPPGR